jgi:hypothetical protein
MESFYEDPCSNMSLLLTKRVIYVLKSLRPKSKDGYLMEIKRWLGLLTEERLDVRA